MGIDSVWLALGAFALLVVIAELLFPVRARQPQRWPANTAFGAASILIASASRFAGPLAGALWAESQDFGLLRLVAMPDWALLLFAVAGMDLAVWFQHLLFHRVGFLWRLHQLHHRDPTLDISTGFRFHPAEAGMSLIYKGACAALLGVPVWAVAAFEAWLIAGNLFEHANIRLPERLDRVLRWLVVTPPMHRVHHSRHGNDAQHNYGFAIPLWDRLFGTYREKPGGDEIGAPHA